MDSLSEAASRRATRKPALPLRYRWQDEALVETRAGFAHQSHRYAQAPMGTGKTRFMLDACEAPEIKGARVL